MPLLKRVLALPGQTVCRAGAVITVDGVDVGEARDRDRLGRPLPVWQGCRTLRPGRGLPHESGPSTTASTAATSVRFPVTSIIGRAVPIWTDEDGDGRFVWRAADRTDAPHDSYQPQENSDDADRSIHAHQVGLFRAPSARCRSTPRSFSFPPTTADAENAPDYRILLGDDDGPEIGAAWKRIGEKAGDYVSLLLDDPALTQPIRANLFQSSEDKSSWILHWTRSRSAASGTDDMRSALPLMIKSDRLNRACTRARFTLLLLFGLAPACRWAESCPQRQRRSSARPIGDPYAVHVAEAARRFGIPAAWIRAVMRDRKPRADETPSHPRARWG